jgi:hypothetical protein
MDSASRLEGPACQSAPVRIYPGLSASRPTPAQFAASAGFIPRGLGRAPGCGRMTIRPSTIERAFQLAKSGEYADVGAIRQQLTKEGLPDPEGQISGPTLLRQLRQLCANARSPEASA